jgi:hypothetical protein
LVATAGGGSLTGLNRELSGTQFPFTLPGVFSITASKSNTGVNTGSYNYFYDWNVYTGNGCETSRTAVQAVINPTTAITLSRTLNNICAGAATQISVTSNNSNYTYSWTPGATKWSYTYCHPNHNHYLYCYCNRR